MTNLLTLTASAIEVYTPLPDYSISTTTFYDGVTYVYNTSTLEQLGFIAKLHHGLGYAAYTLDRLIVDEPVDTFTSAIKLFNN